MYMCIMLYLQELKAKMPTVSDMAMRTAEKLLEAASRLSENPTSSHAQAMMASSAQSILEWTVKVGWDCRPHTTAIILHRCVLCGTREK